MFLERWPGGRRASGDFKYAEACVSVLAVQLDGTSDTEGDSGGCEVRCWRSVTLALAATVALSSHPAWASGVSLPTAVFPFTYQPDSFDQFAAGRLGVIKPTWHLDYLYVAYRYMAGPGFDADEQKALIAYWTEKA